jgi:hypothetical protein
VRPDRSPLRALETALQDAGVPFRALEILDDASRDTAPHLQLDAAASRDDARHVLGGFALPFTIA